MGRVGFAEFSAFPLAAMRVIQPESAESWVGFDLVDRHEVRIRRADNGATLRITSGGSTLTATRLATATRR